MQTYWNQRKSERRPRLFPSLGIQLLVYSLLVFSTPAFLSAPVFQIPPGDVPGLIAAINAANANGEENTIILEAGTYTLTAVDNGPPLPSRNGLPVITSALTLRAVGAVIVRDFSAPLFRILSVAATGRLRLVGLSISGGRSPVGESGGGLVNSGTITITESSILGTVAPTICVTTCG